MRPLAILACLLTLAGCGGDDTIQITGNARSATEEQKAALEAADKKVDDQERSNTPTKAKLRSR